METSQEVNAKVFINYYENLAKENKKTVADKPADNKIKKLLKENMDLIFNHFAPEVKSLSSVTPEVKSLSFGSDGKLLEKKVTTPDSESAVGPANKQLALIDKKEKDDKKTIYVFAKILKDNLKNTTLTGKEALTMQKEIDVLKKATTDKNLNKLLDKISKQIPLQQESLVEKTTDTEFSPPELKVLQDEAKKEKARSKKELKKCIAAIVVGSITVLSGIGLILGGSAFFPLLPVGLFVLAMSFPSFALGLRAAEKCRLSDLSYRIKVLDIENLIKNGPDIQSFNEKYLKSKELQKTLAKYSNGIAKFNTDLNLSSEGAGPNTTLPEEIEVSTKNIWLSDLYFYAQLCDIHKKLETPDTSASEIEKLNQKCASLEEELGLIKI